MKHTSFKSLFLTGVAMVAIALSSYAQTTGASGSTGSPVSKKGNKPAASTQGANQAQPGINDAGSSAQVRHDRTGSLDPGHAKSGGTKGATGPTGK